MTLEFEWDPAKAAANLAKHGVSFEDARWVFVDPDRIERPDPKHRSEPRWQSLGEVDGIVLFVVHTERNGRIRLISARKAARHERETYEAGSF